ncbi:MAG: excinuclease ABC subunit UvrC [Alphaproteobacteria bacterium]|nr:excinuclease ABC subunit UvrC [Alphaproteobacteria bacterium]
MLDNEILSNLSEPLEKGAEILRNFVKTLPSSPGIYRMLNQNQEVLYIGKAKNLKKRVISYCHIQKLPNRLQRMVAELHNVEVVITHTEIEALLLESNLIKKLQPRYNVLLKDDKSFPYILLTKDHSYSRIVKHRGPQAIKGSYYGPFASIIAVDETILTLQKLFQIRNCNDNYFAARTRPCLQYHIKRCTAPCVGKISHTEYGEAVNQAEDFLLGKAGLVQEQLAEKMTEASEALEFEKAASYRDRIQLLTKIQSRQRINVSGIKDADVVALAQLSGKTCVQIFFFRYGRNFGTESFMLAHTSEETPEASMSAFLTQFYAERIPAPVVLMNHEPEELQLIKDAFKEKHMQTTAWEVPKLGLKKELIDHAFSNAKASLERKQSESASVMKIFNQIAELFELSKVPTRIEIYDNSHIQGTDAYGVMVVANQQGFDKKSYRKFAIQTLEGKGDDYGMMREVMKRRFAHKEEWVLPDLLLIDGGEGQLSTVLTCLQEMELDLPVVAIAKGPERNAGKERFFMPGKDPITLPENSPILHFLQRLRDEAHRFAIGTHRNKRQKKIGQSQLDNIPGIGSLRKKKLLQYFGSVQGVAQAGLTDLQLVEGVNKSVALKIYQYFHEQ